MSSLTTNKLTAIFLCLLACGSGVVTYSKAKAIGWEDTSLAGLLLSCSMLTTASILATAAILAWYGVTPTNIGIVAFLMLCGVAPCLFDTYKISPIVYILRPTSTNTNPE